MIKLDVCHPIRVKATSTVIVNIQSRKTCVLYILIYIDLLKSWGYIYLSMVNHVIFCPAIKL